MIGNPVFLLIGFHRAEKKKPASSGRLVMTEVMAGLPE